MATLFISTQVFMVMGVILVMPAVVLSIIAKTNHSTANIVNTIFVKTVLIRRRTNSIIIPATLEIIMNNNNKMKNNNRLAHVPGVMILSSEIMTVIANIHVTTATLH
jgi:hypothetical protein